MIMQSVPTLVLKSADNLDLDLVEADMNADIDMAIN